MHVHAGDIVEELAQADTAPNTRFNDAKCDSKGRLWCGTMDRDPSVGDQGAFYSFTEGMQTANVQPLISLQARGWA